MELFWLLSKNCLMVHRDTTRCQNPQLNWYVGVPPTLQGLLPVGPRSSYHSPQRLWGVLVIRQKSNEIFINFCSGKLVWIHFLQQVAHELHHTSPEWSNISIPKIYIYIHTYTYTHTHIHTYIHTYIMHTYIHTYICTYIHTLRERDTHTTHAHKGAYLIAPNIREGLCL